jgi:hypothetical protein
MFLIQLRQGSPVRSDDIHAAIIVGKCHNLQVQVEKVDVTKRAGPNVSNVLRQCTP